MNITEVLKEFLDIDMSFRETPRIRRPWWGKYEYIWYEPQTQSWYQDVEKFSECNPHILESRRELFVFGLDEYTADDWEVYKKPEPKQPENTTFHNAISFLNANDGVIARRESWTEDKYLYLQNSEIFITHRYVENIARQLSGLYLDVPSLYCQLTVDDVYATDWIVTSCNFI